MLFWGCFLIGLPMLIYAIVGFTKRHEQPGSGCAAIFFAIMAIGFIIFGIVFDENDSKPSFNNGTGIECYLCHENKTKKQYKDGHWYCSDCFKVVKNWHDALDD